MNIDKYLTDEDAWQLFESFENLHTVVTINPKDWKFIYGSEK